MLIGNKTFIECLNDFTKLEVFMNLDYIKSFFRLLGINPKRLYYSLKGLTVYLNNLVSYKRKQRLGEKFSIQLKSIFPVYSDRYMEAGNAKGHYFHQDLWAARKIFGNSPENHVDIGSRVDGFIAHLLVFRDITVVDVRVLETNVKGLNYVQGDITCLDFDSNSLESISCLHAIEHIGLGRYGDEIDLDGWMKGLKEMQRVLQPGGKLFLGVPIGVERLCFDAHRVFSPSTIKEALDELEVTDFSFVNDEGDFVKSNVELKDVPRMDYGCGLFEFIKPVNTSRN